MNYIAIIGDIKNSKSINDRMEFQNKFNNILNDINVLYNDDISSYFTITLGDEFQGLLHNGKHIMDIISYIKNNLYPYEIRFGIGIGDMTTTINPYLSIGADGPAYHNARYVINELKDMEKQREVAMSDIKLKYNQSIDMCLNTIFKLIYVIEQKWTLRQREIIHYMLIHDTNQLSAASYFNVSPSNIHQILSKGNFYTYYEAIHYINNLFSEVINND